MKSILLLLFVVVTTVCAETVRYDQYSLYRIVPNTEDAALLLQHIELTNSNLDFWEGAKKGEYLNVVVPPQEQETFNQQLSESDVNWEITIKDVQSEIDRQAVRKSISRSPEDFNWLDYQTLDAIYDWLDHLAATYPNIVTLINGGRSLLGREIKGIKISHGPGRKGFFIEGGIHSREWISPAVVDYITNELLTSDDPETVAAAAYFDWYIFPVTNPDGYVHTHEVERLWRKNLRPVGGTTPVGIDLNRNWNVFWNEAGTSSNPSSQTYPGNGPFSEIETRSLSAYIAEVAHTLDIYISFHSSGQMFLIPYGHTTDYLDNYFDVLTIGRRAMGSLAVRYGTQYVSGNIAETIYPAAGTSIDWVKYRFQVPFVACYELRDRGTYGHLLPPEQILPTSEETMDSILAIIREGKFIGYFLNE